MTDCRNSSLNSISACNDGESRSVGIRFVEDWNSKYVLAFCKKCSAFHTTNLNFSAMREPLHISGHKHVHHAYELYVHPAQSQQWLEAWNAKVSDSTRPFTRQNWDHLLAGYTAVTNMPSACFAQELIHTDPDAKVIPGVREEQAWHKSFSTRVIDTYFDNAWTTGIISLLDFQLMRPVHSLWTRLLASKTGFLRGSTRDEVQGNALDIYRKHNAVVIDMTEQSRLLTFRLEQGWKRLCAFLEVEVPDVPFPRVNEGDVIKQVLSAFVQKSMLRALRNLAIRIVVAGLAVKYFV